MEIKMNKLFGYQNIRKFYLPVFMCLIAANAHAMSDQLYIGETIYINDPTVTDVVIGNN